MEKEIQEQLEDLRESLDKSKALHAWKQLKDAEGVPRMPPAFQMYDPVEKDLEIEIAYFLGRILDLHAALDDRQEQWALLARKELITMEKEMAIIRADRKSNVYT